MGLFKTRFRINFDPLALNKGFTLPEVMIATLIAATITVITAQVMIGQLLEGRRLEAAQRNRENFSRLNYLIQIEASEAEEIEIGAQPPGCTTNGGFTLWVPRQDGTYAQANNRSGIQYFNSEDGIERCGPRVFRNGVLDHPLGNDNTNIETAIAVPNAQLTLNCATTAAGQEVAYNVEFTGGNSGAAGIDRCVVAHARSIFVCNPGVDTTAPCSERVGDCDCI